METLPPPAVLACYLEEEVQPPLQALRLCWPHPLGGAERLWYLPRHMTLRGTPPERFGLTLVRRDQDSYALRLLWDQVYLSWTDLTRVQLLASALTPLLRALGQDLWDLLNQPIHTVVTHPAKVA